MMLGYRNRCGTERLKEFWVIVNILLGSFESHDANGDEYLGDKDWDVGVLVEADRDGPWGCRRWT